MSCRKQNWLWSIVTYQQVEWGMNEKSWWNCWCLFGENHRWIARKKSFCFYKMALIFANLYKRLAFAEHNVISVRRYGYDTVENTCTYCGENSVAPREYMHSFSTCVETITQPGNCSEVQEKTLGGWQRRRVLFLCLVIKVTVCQLLKGRETVFFEAKKEKTLKLKSRRVNYPASASLDQTHIWRQRQAANILYSLSDALHRGLLLLS